MKRIIITIASMLICLALAWVAGFDFDSRGHAAFMTTWATLWAGWIAWVFLGIKK